MLNHQTYLQKLELEALFAIFSKQISTSNIFAYDMQTSFNMCFKQFDKGFFKQYYSCHSYDRPYVTFLVLMLIK